MALNSVSITSAGRSANPWAAHTPAERRRMRAEPREEVQVQADDEQVGGVERVAIAVEEGRVGARGGGEFRLHVEFLPPGQGRTIVSVRLIPRVHRPHSHPGGRHARCR